MSCRTPLPLILLALSLIGCSSDPAVRRSALIQENLTYAQRHMAAGDQKEAAQFYQAVLLADPQNTEAQNGLDGIPDPGNFALEPTLLGKNHTAGLHRDSLWLRALAYPVNRVLDLTDVVSFGVGQEGGFYAGMHATRAMQAGAGAGGGWRLGWWQKRELSVGTDHVAGLTAGPFSAETEADDRAGTRGLTATKAALAGLNRPSDAIYQDARDYWGVGGRVVVLLVGAEVEVHPLEIVDAATGFLFVDFLDDDIGSTRSLNVKRGEMTAMRELVGTLSPSEVRERLQGRLRAQPQPEPMLSKAK